MNVSNEDFLKFEMQCDRIFLGLSIDPEEDIRVIAKETIDPERFEVIKRRIMETDGEDLWEGTGFYEDNSAQQRKLLDSFGVDYLLDTGRQRYAVDITAGNNNTLNAKVKKSAAMKSFFSRLNAIPVIIQHRGSDIPRDVIGRIQKTVRGDESRFCRFVNGVGVIKLRGA